MKKITTACFLILAFVVATAQLPQLGKDANSKIINDMTVQEKARLIMGLGMNVPGFGDNMLQPGKKQTVSFTISKRDLASFDETQSAWVAENGMYKIYIGSSSADIKMNSSFTLQTYLLVKKVNNVLAPVKKITELI